MRSVRAGACASDDSLYIWIEGIREAHEELAVRDAFTLSATELAEVVTSFSGDEQTKADWVLFMRRCDIMATCFESGRGGLPEQQATNLVKSCTAFARQCGRGLLQRWTAKAKQVHAACEELLVKAKQAEAACEELLAAETQARKKKRRKRRKREAEECIICLDARRDHVFQPCGHRVSCGDCAAALAQVSRHCPWCRVSLSDGR